MRMMNMILIWEKGILFEILIINTLKDQSMDK